MLTRAGAERSVPAISVNTLNISPFSDYKVGKCRRSSRFLGSQAIFRHRESRKISESLEMLSSDLITICQHSLLDFSGLATTSEDQLRATTTYQLSDRVTQGQYGLQTCQNSSFPPICDTGPPREVSHSLSET